MTVFPSQINKSGTSPEEEEALSLDQPGAVAEIQTQIEKSMVDAGMQSEGASTVAKAYGDTLEAIVPEDEDTLVVRLRATIAKIDEGNEGHRK